MDFHFSFRKTSRGSRIEDRGSRMEQRYSAPSSILHPRSSVRGHDLALYLLFADMVAQTMIVSRAYEAGKKRVRRKGLRFQFGVRLSAQEPGVIGKLDHLDEFAVGRFT